MENFCILLMGGRGPSLGQSRKQKQKKEKKVLKKYFRSTKKKYHIKIIHNWSQIERERIAYVFWRISAHITFFLHIPYNTIYLLYIT